MSVHDVIERDGRPCILPGTPVTKEIAAQGLANLLQKDSILGITPPEILAHGPGYVCWFTKPQLRQMVVKGFKKTFNVPCPGNIWLVSHGQLYLWAYKGVQRPTAKTRLYRAPYWNVHSNGAVCTGNCDLPSGAEALTPLAWEKMFFGSVFTHPVDLPITDKLNGEVKFWTSKKTFDAKDKFPSAILSEQRLPYKNLTDAFEAIVRITDY